MELNREQIIKDLECCRFGKDEANCKECNWHPWTKPRCWRLLASNALSLIKELTVEKGTWEAIAKSYQKQFEDCAEDRARLTEENERLRAENARYEAENHEKFDKWLKLEEATKRHHAELFQEAKIAVKEETVRKMEDLFDKYFCQDPAFLVVEQRLIMDIIGQIAKEMLEDST